jgi:FkbM family methyltransferase
MKSIIVFLGRAWRHSNRRISRLFLDVSGKRTDHDLVRLGSAQNGWYAPTDLPAGALCYCIGVGRDASFDFELARMGGDVHSFDPTPPAVEYMQENNKGQVAFHPWGVLDKDASMRLYFPLSGDHGSYFIHDLHKTGKFYDVPCYQLSTIMKKLGHSDIHLMKMDIEGSWYEAIPNILASGIYPVFFEIEFDSPAPVWRVSKIVRDLHRHGYRLVLRKEDDAVFKRVVE